MLKRQRLQRVVDHLTDAVDIARAMLRDGHVTTARQFLIAPVGSAWEDVLASAKDPDDYPSQHRAQFDAIVAEVQRLASDCKHEVKEATMSIKGRRDDLAWSSHIFLTIDGVDTDTWSPTAGPISSSGGRVPPDQPPEVTARSLLKAAGVQVPKA